MTLPGSWSPPICVAALLRRGADARRRLARRVARDGMCEIKLDSGLTATLLDALMHEAQGFFRQPAAVKRALALADCAGLRGYVGIGEERTNGVPDCKESFEFAQQGSTPRLEAPYDILSAPNTWPERRRSPHFRATVERYMSELERVGAAIFDAMVDALAVPETQASCQSLRDGRPCHYSRLIRYPAPSERDAGRDPLVDHTDHAFFTLAYQTAPGLEVQTPRGDWTAWPCNPATALVFPGEVAEIWSGGRYRASPHRVAQTLAAGERFAVTTFFMPNLEATVVPLPLEGQAAETQGGVEHARAPYRLLDAEMARMAAIFGSAQGE